jgi:deoxyribodipyrimidine photolyase-related protein
VPSRKPPAEPDASAVDADLSLASQEGFVRQVLGWREFVHHVHEATAGFRTLAGEPLTQNALDAPHDLPPVFWGKTPSGLHCLDRVVTDVWRLQPERLCSRT